MAPTGIKLGTVGIHNIEESCFGLQHLHRAVVITRNIYSYMQVRRDLWQAGFKSFVCMENTKLGEGFSLLYTEIDF